MDDVAVIHREGSSYYHTSPRCSVRSSKMSHLDARVILETMAVARSLRPCPRCWHPYGYIAPKEDKNE